MAKAKAKSPPIPCVMEMFEALLDNRFIVAYGENREHATGNALRQLVFSYAGGLMLSALPPTIATQAVARGAARIEMPTVAALKSAGVQLDPQYDSQAGRWDCRLSI